MKNIHTEFTNFDWVIRMQHTSPLTKKLPKHLMDIVGRIQLSAFGDLKANCTKQTLKVGLG